MQTRTILASELKAGDVLVENYQRWRVDIVATNPRRVLPPNWTYPGYKPSDPRDVDMLVDVDATGLGLRVPCTRFSSYTPATILTIEAPSHNVSGHRVDLFRGEDGGIVVEVPAIPGCITQGKDREEALVNAAEAIAVSALGILGWSGDAAPEAWTITKRADVADMGSAMDDLRRQRDEAHAEVARLIAECDEYRTSALAGIEAVKQSNQALREAAASIDDARAEVARLTIERDALHTRACAGIREMTEGWATSAEEVVRLTAEVERLRIACDKARSAVVDFNDEDEATDLGIHEADERDVAMGNAWRILNAALGAAD